MNFSFICGDKSFSLISKICFKLIRRWSSTVKSSKMKIGNLVFVILLICGGVFGNVKEVRTRKGTIALYIRRLIKDFNSKSDSPGDVVVLSLKVEYLVNEIVSAIPYKNLVTLLRINTFDNKPKRKAAFIIVVFDFKQQVSFYLESNQNVDFWFCYRNFPSKLSSPSKSRNTLTARQGSFSLP